MTVYCYDDWVRVETDYDTWKFDSDEITDIQRCIDRECGHNDIDFVEVKTDGVREDYYLPHEVEMFLENYYFEDIHGID